MHHAVMRLAEVCDDVVVVLASGPQMTSLRGCALPTTRRRARFRFAGLHQGPMAAVRSDAVVVAGGDMPDLQPPVLRTMLAMLADAGVDAVALDDGDGVRPLPCVLRTWPAADVVHTLLHAGRRRLRDVLDALRMAVIDAPTWTALDPERRTLRDVDTPGDLAR